MNHPGQFKITVAVLAAVCVIVLVIEQVRSPCLAALPAPQSPDPRPIDKRESAGLNGDKAGDGDEAGNIAASDKLETTTPCFVSGLASIEQYREYLYKTETTCKNMKQFGGKPPAPQNGKKFICLDERFKIKPNDCLVFSFGVNNEWSFENEIEKFGCRVYAYDPTMGKEDHQHSPNVKFFATGIANYKGMKRIGMGKNWANRKVDRFENLVNAVGEAGRPIDFIKLDVELSEIDFLQDMIFNSPHVLRNVKQIGMEIHHGNFKDDLGPITTFQVFWPYYMLLKCHGFKLIQTRNAGLWREVVWAREVDW